MEEIIEIYNQEAGEEVGTWFNPLDKTYGKSNQEGYVPIPRSIFNEVYERYRLISDGVFFYALDIENKTWKSYKYKSGLATFFWDRLRERLVEENLCVQEKQSDVLNRIKDLNWTKLGYGQTDIYWKGSTIYLGEDVWATILSDIVEGKREGVIDNSEGIWGFWQIESPPYEELLAQIMKQLG